MLEFPRIEPVRRTRRDRSARSSSNPSHAARVTVAWTPSYRDGAPGLGPTEVELVAEVEAAQPTKWTCQQPFSSSWVEAIASARCSEVTLTAKLGGNLSAKHLVLELAELLTHELTATHPLIRVRFPA